MKQLDTFGLCDDVVVFLLFFFPDTGKGQNSRSTATAKYELSERIRSKALKGLKGASLSERTLDGADSHSVRFSFECVASYFFGK